MAITITKIKNLTNREVVEVTGLTGFNNQVAFADEIINKTATAADWRGFIPTDNIQVTWSDDTTKKIVTRAVNGTIKIDGEKVTISGLENASKYSIGLNGQIAVGDPKTPTDAALVSVSIGNLVSKDNPKADTLINLSDKTYADEGTQINLTALLAWIQGQDKGSEKPELPKGEDGAPSPIKPDDFMIEFKELYYNTTQKTFDINVQSSAESEIEFGSFTIKKAGLRITNTLIELPKKETKALAK